MSGTVWVDVDDLLHYFRFNPHPSGIQRVALLIIRAMLARQPDRVRLVRAEGAGWREVTLPAIEAALAAEPEPEPTEAETTDQSLRARVQRRILALPPEMRDPLFRAGVLQSQVLANGRALWHLVRPPPPRPIRALPAGDVLASGGPSPGDLFVALGAPWSVRGAAERMSALRRRGVRTALLVHDLIPLRRPEWSTPARTERFRAWLHATLPVTDTALTLSRFTATDLEAYAREAGLPMPALAFLPAGSSGLSAAASRAPGLPSGPYALAVSTLEFRKNHVLLVHVWHRLVAQVRAGTRAAASVPSLVFAGRVGTGVADLLQQLDNSRWLGGRVRLLREPGDAEVAALYRGAAFTLVPSFYEGWGLPVGESLEAGVPCLAAGTTSLPEAGGGLCRFFDPEDLGDALRTVTTVLDDPAALPADRAAIAAGYRPRDWGAAAETVLALA